MSQSKKRNCRWCFKIVDDFISSSECPMTKRNQIIETIMLLICPPPAQHYILCIVTSVFWSQHHWVTKTDDRKLLFTISGKWFYKSILCGTRQALGHVKLNYSTTQWPRPRSAAGAYRAVLKVSTFLGTQNSPSTLKNLQYFECALNN